MDNIYDIMLEMLQETMCLLLLPDLGVSSAFSKIQPCERKADILLMHIPHLPGEGC